MLLNRISLRTAYLEYKKRTLFTLRLPLFICKVKKNNIFCLNLSSCVDQKMRIRGVWSCKVRSLLVSLSGLRWLSPIPSGNMEAPYLLLFSLPLSSTAVSSLLDPAWMALCTRQLYWLTSAWQWSRALRRPCHTKELLNKSMIKPTERERLIKTFLNSVRYKRGEKPKPLWCDYKRFLCVTLPWAATLRYVKLLPQLFVSCFVFPTLPCLQGCRYMLICPIDEPGEESQTRNIQIQGNLVDATVPRRLQDEWLFSLDGLYSPYRINS